MEGNDKNLAKAEKQRADELEKLRILAEAEAIRGEQLLITPTGDLGRQNELHMLSVSNLEDPERKYEIYYNGIQKLLKAHLPKGKQNKVARNYIYEEKNTYMTQGKRINRAGMRGADSRMGYISDADEMMKVIMDWIISNGTMVDLFNTMRDLNVSKGYGVRTF